MSDRKLFRISAGTAIDVHLHFSRILLFLELHPDTVELEDGCPRDVRHVGHPGVGDLEFRISNPAQLADVCSLIQRASANGRAG